jgi:hypothetical protein
VSAIPLVDAPALAPAARRTFALRTLLLLAALGAAVAFVLVSRAPGTHTIVPFVAGANTIVAVDLSASINYDAYTRIGATLTSLAHGGGRFGLVFFSDEAYEALPPGTPAEDLAPFVRYFRPLRRAAPGIDAVLPANPWQSTFSGGTRIAAGLQLARTLALDGGAHAHVVLLSDLDDAPSDLPQLSHVLIDYERERIPLRIVALPPGYYQDRQYFLRLLKHPAFVSDPELGIRGAARVEGASRRRSATPLVVAALALAALLAANELWCGRLGWRRREAGV